MPYDINQFSPGYGGTINSNGDVVNIADSVDATSKTVKSQPYNTTNSVTISSAGTVSGAITLGGQMLVGLLIPSTWDGGNITIQGCDTLGGTYVDVYDSTGTICTATVGGVSRIVGLSGSMLQAVANIPFIKLKSASAVAANRTIVVLAKG